MGGAERVIEDLHNIFPNAPIFTLVFDNKFKTKYQDWNIRVSWLQKIYEIFPKFQYLLPLIPFAISSLNFSGFDLVISSSSGFIKNIKTPANCKHINYCHTPTRFLWVDKYYVNQEAPIILRPFIKLYLQWMRRWDFKAAQRVDYFLANSKEVQKRISRFYGRDSTVLYPAIDTNFWRPTKEKNNYFLVAGRLQAHKKFEFIINVFNKIGLDLHIAGSGRQEEYLKSISKPNIKFLGRIPDEKLRDEYSSAIAYIYPQIEDFGLMPLEAAACGTPTIAFAGGGSLETVIQGQTGELFFAYDSIKITNMLLNSSAEKYAKNKLIKYSKAFSREKFKENLICFLAKCA